MFSRPVRVCLHEDGQRKTPCIFCILLNSREKLQCLLVESDLTRIGRYGNGLDNLVEFLLHFFCHLDACGEQEDGGSRGERARSGPAPRTWMESTRELDSMIPIFHFTRT